MAWVSLGSLRAVLTGLAWVSLGSLRALDRTVIYPYARDAIPYIDLVGLCHADAIGVSGLRCGVHALQGLQAVIIAHDHKAAPLFAFFTLWARSPTITPVALITLLALRAGLSGVSLRASVAGFTLLALRALFAFWSRNALDSLGTLRTDLSRFTLWANRSGITLRSGHALDTLRPLDALFTLCLLPTVLIHAGFRVVDPPRSVLNLRSILREGLGLVRRIFCPACRLDCLLFDRGQVLFHLLKFAGWKKVLGRLNASTDLDR